MLANHFVQGYVILCVIDNTPLVFPFCLLNYSKEGLLLKRGSV
jgi:hypothetical protein